jgi:hypothetical protein
MKTQAWGWLAAGVLAAGLNASYHDGSFQAVHRMAERVGDRSTAVLALASGRADELLAQARLMTSRTENPSCPLAARLAQVQSRMERSGAAFDIMSARREARLDRWEASRARIEARIAARAAHIRIANVNFVPVAFKAIPAPTVCPRVRVNIPKMPMMNMSVAPQIHIDVASAGPV